MVCISFKFCSDWGDFEKEKFWFHLAISAHPTTIYMFLYFAPLLKFFCFFVYGNMGPQVYLNMQCYIFSSQIWWPISLVYKYIISIRKKKPNICNERQIAWEALEFHSRTLLSICVENSSFYLPLWKYLT